MKKKNIRRWHIHPMARVVLEAVFAFIAVLAFGSAFGMFVVYFMLWLCG